MKAGANYEFVVIKGKLFPYTYYSDGERIIVECEWGKGSTPRDDSPEYHQAKELVLQITEARIEN